MKNLKLIFLPLLSKQKDTYSNEILVYSINDIERKGIMEWNGMWCFEIHTKMISVHEIPPLLGSFYSSLYYLLLAYMGRVTLNCVRFNV